MNLIGEHRIAASRLRVWQSLNDASLLARLIPGCESLARWEDGATCGFEGTLRQHIGPLTAQITGKSTMLERVPPARFTLSGTGNAGDAGSVRGDVEITLDDLDTDVTLLRYTGAFTLAGKLAQLDGWLIEQTGQVFAETFCARLSKLLSHPIEMEGSPVMPLRHDQGLAPRLWVPGFIAATLLLVVVAALL